MSELKCPDCKTTMEKGFLPDQALTAVLQSAWQKGEAEPEISFGFIKSGGVKYDTKEIIPITAHRCTKCGLLRLYARVTDHV